MNVDCSRNQSILRRPYIQSLHGAGQLQGDLQTRAITGPEMTHELDLTCSLHPWEKMRPESHYAMFEIPYNIKYDFFHSSVNVNIC